MKLTIDTQNKTIEINEQVKLSQLKDELKKLFPDTWGDFTLVPHYEPYQQWIYPYNPYPSWTVGTGQITSTTDFNHGWCTDSRGTYHIDENGVKHYV